MKNHRFSTTRCQVLVIGWTTGHIASEHRTNEVDTAEMFNILDLLQARKIAAKGEAVDNQLPSQLEEGAAGDSAGPRYEKRGPAVVEFSPFASGSLPRPHTSGGRVLQRITTSNHAGTRHTGSQFLLRRSGIFAVSKTSAP